MATDPASVHELPAWSRLVEWSILIGVIVVLMLVLARQVRVVQGQAELAALRSTLNALRTALLIDHLHKSVAPVNSTVAMPALNPFALLQQPPTHYLGEMTAAEAELAPAGSWVFDPVCVCVGYLPIYAQWFDSPSGATMAWYQLGGDSGPLHLTAKEAYVWQGQAMK